jgi:TetR/AcrR family transcriptional repressor of nem operon
MARPIEFDRNQVLQKAIPLFWLKGYQATSIKNLVDATGLQPGSLYSAFGDKRGLFLAALDAYFEGLKQHLFGLLRGNNPPIERLEAFFQQLVQESYCDPDRKGCLLINTLSEIPVQDTEINTHLQKMFAEVELELKAILVEYQALNPLSGQQNPGKLAKFLMTGIFGLRLFNKTQPDAASLHAIVAMLMSVVKTASPELARQCSDKDTLV